MNVLISTVQLFLLPPALEREYFCVCEGEIDIVARQLAGLVKSGRSLLAVQAATTLAQTNSAKPVTQSEISLAR